MPRNKHPEDLRIAEKRIKKNSAWRLGIANAVGALPALLASIDPVPAGGARLVSRSTISLMIRDTNPPETGRRESGVSEPRTTLFGEAIFQKVRGCFNHVFSEHDTRGYLVDVMALLFVCGDTL
jgi:hypothetical protein